MGIVSDDEFEKELNKNTTVIKERKAPVVTGEIIDPTKLGRGNNPEVPNGLRQIIGETHALSGRADALELARNFGISNSSADAYGHGATSTASYNKPSENKDHLQNRKQIILKKAHSRLSTTLTQITDDKLQGASLKDLAVVARAMGGVIRDLEPPPKDATESKQTPQFIIFAPRQMREEDFGAPIDARE